MGNKTVSIDVYNCSNTTQKINMTGIQAGDIVVDIPDGN